MGFAHLQQKSGFVIQTKRDQKGRKGYSTYVDRNGLIQVVPRRRKERSFLGPARAIAIFVVLLTLFKALAVINVGPTSYAETLAQLQAGTLFEQAGAWILQVDPGTAWLYHIAQFVL